MTPLPISVFPNPLQQSQMNKNSEERKSSLSGLAGETKKFLSLNEVFHSHLDLLEVIEDVKLCQVKRIVAIDLTRVLHHDEI